MPGASTRYGDMVSAMEVAVFSIFLLFTLTVKSLKRIINTVPTTTAKIVNAAVKYVNSFLVIGFLIIGGHLKPISDTPYCFDVPFRMAVMVELCPETLNMAVHSPAVSVIIITPQRIQ